MLTPPWRTGGLGESNHGQHDHFRFPQTRRHALKNKNPASSVNTGFARRLAWIHATSSNESLLDGERALQILAEHCQVEESGSPLVWDTYAAALARVGRFAEATAAAERAMDLATEANREELREKIAQRLASYSGGHRWQQTGGQS